MTRLSNDLLEDLRTNQGDGDHDVFSHYAHKEDIIRSMVEGTPLIALCGKVWVPFRDPQKYPVCGTCKEIFESLPRG